MPKEYFDFKQFRVFQDKCAMKVCTDSCLFGASIELDNAKNILDIGTGTGLLSLMIAQQATENLKITAVELDYNAAFQAIKNIKNSTWSDIITVLNQSIQSFCNVENKNTFDLIVSNPPFFQKNLKSPQIEANMARHDVTLSFLELYNCINHLLSIEGVFYILLPPIELISFLKFTQNDFIETERINIKSNKDASVFRCISKMKRKNNENSDSLETEISIYEKNGTYTSDFINKLKSYYTIF